MPLKTPKKGLTADQITMLVEVVKRTQANVSANDWAEIAQIISSPNGKAARERFRYLMQQLNANPAAGDDSPTPKVLAKKHAAVTLKGIKAKKPKKEEPAIKDEVEEEENGFVNTSDDEE